MFKETLILELTIKLAKMRMWVSNIFVPIMSKKLDVEMFYIVIMTLLLLLCYSVVVCVDLTFKLLVQDVFLELDAQCQNLVVVMMMVV